MGWSATPLMSSKDLLTAAKLGEINAALDERMDAVNVTGKPPAINSGDLIKWSNTINNYRYKAVWLATNRFYKKTGSGSSTAFTLWTTSEFMEAAFGSGVTSWPSGNGELLKAQQLNELQTAINLLKYFAVPAATYRVAYYQFPSGSGSSKDAAQDDYDARTYLEQILYDPYMPHWSGNGAGIPKVRPGMGWPSTYIIANDGNPNIVTGRDLQIIYEVTAPNVTLVKEWRQIKCRHSDCWETQDAPEVDTPVNMYRDTAVPTDTFAALRAYGTWEAGLTMSGYMSSYEMREYSTPLLQKNADNYIRLTARAALARDLTDELWGSYNESSYDWPAASFCAALTGIFVEGQFDYRAA